MKALDRPFEVKRSATGLGLFATKRIPKGKKIVEYTGPRVPNDIVEKSNGKYFFGVNKKWSINGSGRIVKTLDQARDEIEHDLTEEKIQKEIDNFIEKLFAQPGTEIVILNPV